MIYFFGLAGLNRSPQQVLAQIRFTAWLPHATSLAGGLVIVLTVPFAQADQGMLRIATKPGDAQIFINGQRKGNSPSEEGQNFAIKLREGEYMLAREEY